MSKISDAELVNMQLDCGTPNPPTQGTYWFRKAVAGEGPRAYDWSDKPHRLVFDLCRLIEADAALRSGGEEKDGVGVKPLEWHGPDVNGDIHARSILAVYTVRKKQGSLGYWLTEVGGYHSTIDVAKAAAQADYERRILSALTNTEPSLRAENERLRTLVSASEAERVRSCSELMARATTAEAKLDEVAKVLEPFAIEADQWDGYPDNEVLVTNYQDFNGEILVSHLRAARSFLSNLKGVE